jgi:hypothetical protein
MAQVEISLKLNVDLQIKAEREDIPQLTESVKDQLAGAFTPANLIANGQQTAKHVRSVPPIAQTPSLPTPVPHPVPAATPIPSKPRRARRPAQSKDGTPPEDLAVDWVNDPSKWGAPAQSWDTADRSLWLLYVLKHEVDRAGLSGVVIAATLSKHFRQAGLVYPQIVNRVLGKLKSAAPPLVGEDSTKKPSEWFLTESGLNHVESLIAQTRTQTTQSTT